MGLGKNIWVGALGAVLVAPAMQAQDAQQIVQQAVTTRSWRRTATTTRTGGI